jgi:two-component system phosphate regulon sensor histidine kinase PhoR
MNATRIKLIIGLMSLALIGIIGLQAYWINWNINFNEKKFDNDVFESLNSVANRLQNYEISQMKDVVRLPDQAMNGFVARKMANATPDQNGNQSAEDRLNPWEYKKVMELIDSRPLAERIPLDALNKIVREEIRNKGINAEYQYGVYSEARNSYVIVNDHFVVEDSGPQVSHGGAPTLFNSPYKVSLFNQDIESPGYLSLYFPNRTRLVLGSSLSMLLLSVVFTSIIMFSFWYTIQVIFRQKQLSEIKNDFINNMTHEFKTPIATISLAADSIGSPVVMGNPDKIRRFIDIIRQENRRMNSQVERVLQMALIDKKDFELKIAEVNVHDLVLQAVDNFSLQVEKREGTIHTELLAEKPVIEADATHLTSVIHNLLDNANKYSPEKPDITVSTRNVPIGIEITVTDHGMGISKEARKHIFDKFYRVHTGNIHDVKGFGLGLSYVKAIMVAHKGLVDVKSEPGKGSSFSLTLPRRQRPSE